MFERWCYYCLLKMIFDKFRRFIFSQIESVKWLFLFFKSYVTGIKRKRIIFLWEALAVTASAKRPGCARKKELKKIKKKSASCQWWKSSKVKVLIPDCGKIEKNVKQSVFYANEVLNRSKMSFLVHDTVDKIKVKKPLFLLHSPPWFWKTLIF